MTEHEITITAEGVVAGYLPGVDILTGVDLTLGTGELDGIIGPNGAGKSTLVKALFGLVKIKEGLVKMRGEDITNLAAHELVARGVGYVPQRANVFETLTAEENLRMGLYLDPDAWDDRLPVVLELFPHLRTKSDLRAGFMSGGERQMLAMGRALMMSPDVLLLDEPSAGLSPANQDHVFDRVRDICDSGVSIVMVEQNARRCLQICDRAYVMDQGKNAYTGPGRELLHDPKIIDLYLGTLGRAK
jgi:branched-chain amino acid transport system ATP-binding protein